jgi:hypothetical protein
MARLSRFAELFIPDCLLPQRLLQSRLIASKRDFEAGAARALYREVGQGDLRDSPVPRYDLLGLDAYTLPV